MKKCGGDEIEELYILICSECETEFDGAENEEYPECGSCETYGV